VFVKLMGTVLVIGGLGIYGVSRAMGSENRVVQLTNLRLSLNFLEKEISCTRTPLTRALLKTAAFADWPVNCLYRQAAGKLNQKHMTAHEAWNYGIDSLSLHSDLKNGDLELLRSAGPQLGMSDITEQRKFLDLLQEELAIQIEKARGEAESARRIWTYAGFIAGAMVVLLII
jgi:stage III sporulation protein AB